MAKVMIHEGGNSSLTFITKMFATQGPHLLGNRRFDQLISATVVRDASTVSTIGKTEGTATTSVSSQVGRSAAGYIVAGPVGAIIGGSGGKQNLASTTVTDQTTNTDVYMHLQFKGESGPISVQIKDEEAFQIIQSYIGGTEWTEAQLDKAKVLGVADQSQRDRRVEEELVQMNIQLKANNHAAIAALVIYAAFGIYALYGFTQSDSWFGFKLLYMLFLVGFVGTIVATVVALIIHSIEGTTFSKLF